MKGKSTGYDFVSPPVYNISEEVPLATGFYTNTTARAAVPVPVRKTGLILTYETSAGTWYQERFIGTDIANWTTAGNWVQMPDKTYVDNSVSFKPTTSQGNVLFAGATNNILGDSNLFWDNVNKYFGIGLNNPASPFDIKTLSSIESAPLGAELLDGTGWTSEGWSGDFVNGFTHTAGNTSKLTDLPTLVNGGKYQCEVIVTNRTAGSFKINLGGSLGQIDYSSNGTKTQGDTVISNALPLEIVPTTDFKGTIKVSLKRIIGTYNPTTRIINSLGSVVYESRSSSINTNQFIGVGAGRYNTTGYYNTANGVNALYSNTTGYYNTANGVNALYSNTTGYNNTANGYAALYSNTTGYSNTANGYAALYSNTTGYNNTANGYQALYNNTTGYYNTANGVNALYSNTTGYYNTANGYQALYNIGRVIPSTSIITGYNYTIQSIGTTDFTLIGATSNTVGLTFTATGVGSGTGTVSHNSNNNVGEGINAGRYITGGANPLNSAVDCTYIGRDTKAKADGATKEIVIGANATGNGSSTATIGDSVNTGTFFKSVYAELYAADNSTAQLIPTGATYTKINQFTTAGQTNTSWVTASAANDNLVVLKPGRYKIEATASTKSGTANVLLKTAVFVGGVKAANIQAERKIVNANDTSLISIGGIINITSANTEVDVRVAHDNVGSVNITCVHCNLNLIYISE